MHGVNHVQLGQAFVGDLLLCKRPWYDADDASAVSQTSIGERAHETDVAAAVNQFEAAPGQELTEVLSRSRVNSLNPETGSAEDTNAPQHHSSVGGDSGEGECIFRDDPERQSPWLSYAQSMTLPSGAPSVPPVNPIVAPLALRVTVKTIAAIR